MIGKEQLQNTGLTSKRFRGLVQSTGTLESDEGQRLSFPNTAQLVLENGARYLLLVAWRLLRCL